MWCQCIQPLLNHNHDLPGVYIVELTSYNDGLKQADFMGSIFDVEVFNTGNKPVEANFSSRGGVFRNWVFVEKINAGKSFKYGPKKLQYGHYTLILKCSEFGVTECSAKATVKTNGTLFEFSM